jgi:hypothetical protein
MKISILLILLLLAAPLLAEQPKQVSGIAQLSLALPTVGKISPLPAGMSFNFQSAKPGSPDRNLSGLAEDVNNLLGALSQWTEKISFWKMGKGLAIPLTIGRNPMQFFPSLNYNAKDPRKNSFSLSATLKM